MARRQHTNVLIVGAGPVGLLAATVLADRGIDVTVMDTEERTGLHNYAVVLHPATLRLLSELGLATQLVERGHRVEKLVLYDGHEPRGHVVLGQLGLKPPFLLVLPLATLEDALEDRLRARGVTVNWNHRVASLTPDRDGAVALVEQLGSQSGGYAWASAIWVVEKAFDLEADYVIGADGFHSFVRRSLGIPFAELGEPAIYAVAEFSAPEPPPTEASLVLSGASAGILWPLPDRRWRWSIQALPEELPLAEWGGGAPAVIVGKRAFPFLPEERLRALLSRCAPWFTPTLSDLHWSMVVRFDRRLADEFGEGRFWLAGDAAHVTAPIGVQSLNVGLREAHDLASRIADLVRGKASAEAALATYDLERLAEWRQLLGADGPLVPGPDAEPWLGDHAAQLLAYLPGSGPELAALAAALGMALPARKG